ncbi:sensor histidine kinase [Georgenia alba]|uniref:histidine kinase n=1 Tax=Georgenia alba TaxID=2233858 RepID=A0ABW2Q999_9MICO
MRTFRLLVRRSAWLMLGAAIGLAVVLVAATTAVPLWATVVLSMLGCGALSLVPGVRELEVTAARTMLGTDAELVAPRRPRTAHRAQTAGWVLLHLVGGLLVAFGLFAILPAAVLVLVEAIGGRDLTATLQVPTAGLPRPARGALAVLVALVALGLPWAAGAVAARLAGRMLGPTAHDLLDVAVDRAAREAERTRLARELHDGIGHALTIVSVQAAAGRRVLEQDPPGAAAALGTIEDTAREALAELDEMLAVLREDRPGTVAPLDLDAVVDAHRRAGLDVVATIDLPEGLPTMLQRNIRRIVAEALTNAHRHGGDGATRLTVARAGDTVTVEVVNPRGGGAVRRSGGRGLAGLRERVALFDGTVQAGADGETWVVRATLPVPEGAARE